jgi:acetoin utilization deacetylase AcuC-like enzyme
MFPIIYTDDFLLHQTGAFHPEKPERLTAIKLALHHAEPKRGMGFCIFSNAAIAAIMKAV